MPWSQFRHITHILFDLHRRFRDFLCSCGTDLFEWKLSRQQYANHFFVKLNLIDYFLIAEFTLKEKQTHNI